MTNPMPITVHGLEGSCWARRTEALAAIVFHRELAKLAQDVAALDPDGQAMAKAAELARDEAVEAVMLWRTAIAERSRAAIAEAQRPRRSA